jgi:hypothetical protein
MLLIMSQPLHVFLSEEQRQHLNRLIKKGNTPARVQTRARILLLSERTLGQRRTRKQVAEAALVCPVTVGRLCRAFAQEGLEAALYDRPRPGALPKITGDIEAKLVTLACSEPPSGRGRWTLRLLADTMVELGYLESISNQAIGQRLKKTS